MPFTHIPPSDGLLNLNRACRWCWNFGTFLLGQTTSPWNANTVCLTFKKEDLNILLANTNEDSAGIRFYVGRSNVGTSNPESSYLQLFAVKAKSHELFANNPNTEITYNDVIAPNGAGPIIFGYDVTQSSDPRGASPVNPAKHPISDNGIPPKDGPRSLQSQHILISQTYPTILGNKVTLQSFEANVSSFYESSRGLPNSPVPVMNQVAATTVHDPSLGTPDTAQFTIDPAIWPWAFFFHKAALIDRFGDGMDSLTQDVRVYFGVTDIIDSNDTGVNPGMLQLFIVGVETNNDDELISSPTANNSILDFSLPCPQYCGSVQDRVWTKPS